MGCSDSLYVEAEYTKPVTYNPKPLAPNYNEFYEQYPQNNINSANAPTPYQPVNNPNNNNTNTVTYNTNNASNVNQNQNANTKKVESSVVKPKSIIKSEYKENSNQVAKSTKSSQSLKNEKIILESDDFEDSEYAPIFKDDLYDKDVQKITKVFSDLQDEDDIDSQGKVHYIYVTLNYGENCIDIIEIEKSLTTEEYKKHLKITKIENECSMERAKSYLEKYNTDFEVDSAEWYDMNISTNIYVKSEKEPSGYINMFEVIYDKSISKLKFRRKKTETNFNFDCEPFTATPEVVVQNYNLLKSDFVIDHSAEEFKPPKNNSNFGNNFGNNNFNNMFQNMFGDKFGNMFGNNNPGNINSQKIEKNGNGVNIKNNINMMNNFANFGNGFRNECSQFSEFKTNFHLNQEIKVELPKTQNRGGGGGGGSRRRRANDSYEDNASNKSKSSKGSRDSAVFKNGSRVDKHGNIYNERGDKKGRFGNFGNVEDENGFQKAKIGRDYINDNHGNKKLEFSNGEVRDADGNKLGEIRDGVVRDADGNEIGDCRGLSDGEAAYKHFFKD